MPGPAASRGSILVVDDEPTIAEVVARYLERAGYETRTAADGPSAVAAAIAERPDLLVLDIMLPGFDGLEVMRRVHDDLEQRVAVILLTAKGEESDRVIGLRRGADDYVVKPFSPAELVARVDAVLRRTVEDDEVATKLAFDDLVIDPVSRTVQVRGGEIELTQREFDLLLFLARHPGQVFSREQLMDRVWQFSFYTDTTTVTVHIRRVRAKIESDPSDPRWIQTVWGLGYRFPAGAAVIASLGMVAAAGALAAVLIGPVYGSHAAFVTAALVATVSALGLAAAHWISRRPWRGPLRRRFALAVGIAVGVVLITVLATAELMFVSNHDALMVSAIVLAAALVALRAARVASVHVAAEVEEIRDVLRAVGGGAREQRVHAAAAAELTDLATAANSMIAQLAEEEARRDASDTARRGLVAAVSHDLRTPMAALRLMVDAIEDGLVDDETRTRYLATMRTHVTALGSMIDDLFELSRIEAGDLEWSIEQVELPELVGETVAAMRVEAEAKGVEVAAELTSLLRPARADPEKLQRVLFNLIQNAIRHTPPDGSVTVRAEPYGEEWVEIEVADTGNGIDPADRERVFDPFVRGQESRTGEGTGLGLAISRAIVEAHGGRIWLADSDVGTRVRFVIPT